MKKTCTYYNLDFELTAADLDFYQRVSPKFNGKRHEIPPPSLSPDARLIRRMCWRNDRTFFKRRCSLSGKQMVAIYPEATPFPVYHPNEWWSDRWDPEDYSRELSLDRPFFEQWHELMQVVPRLGIDIVNCENSDYCNYCGDDKNCYLDIAGEANEDCYYNLFTKYSKNCVDCTFVYNSELSFQSINCYSCHDIRYAYYLENCSNCGFCFDLKDCHNCLFSSNLRHKQYYVHNKACSKEEYQRALAALELTNRSKLKQHVETWREVIARAIHRDMYNLNSEDCTGDNIKNSKNCKVCFNISNCWDCKYLYDVLDAKDCYDLNYSLYKPEASYELISTLNMTNSAFCMASHYCDHCFYCDQCNNSNNLFGCIGMNQRSYCILNKQYSKEEYETLVPKLVEAMTERGEWGEFFPSELSPWAYNDTVAQEYFPLSEAKAKELGHTFRTFDTLAASGDVRPPVDLQQADETTSATTYYCTETGKAFRIIPQELGFYQHMGVALPDKAPDARHLERLRMRNPRKLYERTCDKLGTNTVSTYAPDRPETVYCEQAYFDFVR